MESQIKIRATVPEMNTFFEEESGVRYMEIRDRRYSSDEIERMPESKFNSKVFMWAVSLRHPKVGIELERISKAAHEAIGFTYTPLEQLAALQ